MKNIYLTFFLLLSLYLPAQYIESFDVANRGILGGCSNSALASCSGTNFSGVLWTLGGDLSGVDSEEGLFTQPGGYLLFEDTDEPACWISPTLRISGAGPVELVVTITIPSGTMWENSTTPGSIDFADVSYSVDGGPYTTIPNITGCPGSGHTISASSCGFSLTGPITYTPTASGITGSLLDIRICFDTNSGDDDGWLEEVSVNFPNVVALPIELTSFHSVNLGKEVELEWSSINEVNNYLFEVEHSLNGVDFYKIGEIEGAGTTREEQFYTFMHRTPGFGLNYYRLKQTDFDGTFQYSYIISENFEAPSFKAGDLYPNPSQSGEVHLAYRTDLEQDLDVTAFSITGSLVLSQKVPAVKGLNNLALDFSSLDKGVYLIQVSGSETPVYRKLIIGN